MGSKSRSAAASSPGDVCYLFGSVEGDWEATSISNKTWGG